MEAKSGGRGRAVFPFYLKSHADNGAFLKWTGERLIKERGGKTVAQVAKAARVSTEQIQKMEQGEFHLNLGQIRDILRTGYGCNLEYILEKCYEAFRGGFDPRRKRRFTRDYHYSFCFGREDISIHQQTPMLIGGDPLKFLWAVPFRKLKKQPLVMELLELAPLRKRRSSGETAENSHEGVEIVAVIHGSIRVHIEGRGSEGPYSRQLKHENCIHFNSSFPHRISNEGTTTSALLLVVRLPELPNTAS